MHGGGVTSATMLAMKARVLVVDDDPALAEMLTIVLRGEGFETAVVNDGTKALPALRELKPDLVLLDLMLPGINGIDVCKAIRTESVVPIVMLTAKSDTVDVVLGLESGADDYVVKPFKPKELIARLRARLRRTDAEPAEVLTIGDVTIDVPGHEVTRDGQSIALTPLEFDLLVALARKPRQVFTREVLLEQVWGYRHAADTRLVNVHVQRLRSKVERDPERPEVVLTVRGVGYKAGPPTLPSEVPGWCRSPGDRTVPGPPLEDGWCELRVVEEAAWAARPPTERSGLATGCGHRCRSSVEPLTKLLAGS